MKHFFLTATLLLLFFSAKGQYLYPEHYLENVSSFCLDCGEPKAMPPENFPQQFMMKVDGNALKRIKGDIYLQILIDSTGHAALLSADNQTNVSSKKLKLEQAINSIQWTPAGGEDVAKYQSVQLLIQFQDDMMYTRRLTMTMGDKEPVESKNRHDKSHTHTFKVYNTANSNLPWNMSRAVAIDPNGTVWMGTDQGLACLKGDEMYVFNQENSPLRTYPKNRKDMLAIMAMECDNEGRIWISQGYEHFIVANGEWSHFNDKNSPVGWGIRFSKDKCGNLWLPTSNGTYRQENGRWITVDSTTYPLPSNNIMTIYTDSRHRTWIGSRKGSIMVDGDSIETFENTPFSIKDKDISRVLEDKAGNIWITIFGSDKEATTALRLYDKDGKWHEYSCPLIKNWKNETISDIALNEETNELWISIYHIGLALLHTDTGKWELYTPDNSNLPDSYIEDIELDKNGKLWVATFRGFATEE